MEPLFAVALSKSVLQIVHRTAGPLAVLVAATVVDTQKVFREVSHHTEEGSDPHPKYSAGAAGNNGRGNTRNITGSYGCSQCRAKGLELGNGFSVGFFGSCAVLLKNAGNGVFPPEFKMTYLEYSSTYGKQNTGTDKQNQAGKTPDRAVYGVVD